MKDLIKYISAKRLMERWNLEEFELRQLPLDGYYEKYMGTVPIDNNIVNVLGKSDDISEIYTQFVKVDIGSIDNLLSCKFKLSDVYELEEKHPKHPGTDQKQLTAKDSRDLGRLQRKKSKWDDL